jgi:hypothetical protein
LQHYLHNAEERACSTDGRFSPEIGHREVATTGQKGARKLHPSRHQAPSASRGNLFLIIRRLTPTRYRVNLSFRECQDAIPLSARTRLGTLAERKLAGGILDASFARALAKAKYLT